jgi:hypothetical protein
VTRVVDDDEAHRFVAGVEPNLPPSAARANAG